MDSKNEILSQSKSERIERLTHYNTNGSVRSYHLTVYNNLNQLLECKSLNSLNKVIETNEYKYANGLEIERKDYDENGILKNINVTEYLENKKIKRIIGYLPNRILCYLYTNFYNENGNEVELITRNDRWELVEGKEDSPQKCNIYSPNGNLKCIVKFYYDNKGNRQTEVQFDAKGSMIYLQHY